MRISWKKICSRASRLFSALISVTEKETNRSPSRSSGFAQTRKSKAVPASFVILHSLRFSLPASASTMELTAPHMRQNSEVPHPPGILFEWTQLSASPGRCPRRLTASSIPRTFRRTLFA